MSRSTEEGLYPEGKYKVERLDRKGVPEQPDGVPLRGIPGQAEVIRPRGTVPRVMKTVLAAHRR